jgi:malate synthase
MSALIPIKNDPAKNEVAMAGIIADKRRDAEDGYDGGWVAHPGLVEASMKEFVTVLGDRPNQFDKLKPEVKVAPPTCSTSGPRSRSPRPACA